MRKLIGPAVLVLLAAVSLFFLQHHPQQNPQRTTDAASSPATGPPAVSALTPTPPSSPLPSSPPPSSTPPLPTRPTDAGQDTGVGADPKWTPVGPTASVSPRDKAQASRFTRAERVATKFMTAFARPPATASPKSWWSGVKPLLSLRSVDDYAGTDPSSVPFTRVTGLVVVVPSDAPSDLVTVVRVPTDAGAYLVEVEHTAAGWFVLRATPVGAGK